MDSSHPATCEVAAPFVLVINCKRCNYLTRDHETLANTRWLNTVKDSVPGAGARQILQTWRTGLEKPRQWQGEREAGFAVGHAAPTVRLDLKKTWQNTLSQSAK